MPPLSREAVTTFLSDVHPDLGKAARESMIQTILQTVEDVKVLRCLLRFPQVRPAVPECTILWNVLRLWRPKCS